MVYKFSSNIVQTLDITNLRDVLSSLGFGLLNSDGEFLLNRGDDEKLLLSSDG